MRQGFDAGKLFEGEQEEANALASERLRSALEAWQNLRHRAHSNETTSSPT